MRLSQLSFLAASFAAAQAFLIPPAVSEADSDIVKALPFEDAVGIANRVVGLRCRGCPTEKVIEGTTEPAKRLDLGFSISHDESVDRLFLNGMQIYPLDPRSTTFMEPLTGSLSIRTEGGTWELDSTPKLGYSLNVRHPAHSNNDQLDLISIHLEIVEVADKFIDGIPTITLKLLETPSGKLMIGDLSLLAPAEVSKPIDNGKECTSMICKWQAIIADRISKLKGGCHKGKGKGRPAEVEAVGEKNHGHHDDKTHKSGGPHRPYRHHHRHGSIARILRGIVMHVFIPVLIGVMVGITASLIGMVVGHIAIFIWRMLFRRGQRGQRGQCSKYTKVAQNEAGKADDEEAKSFLQNQGPPPEYEIVVKEDKAEEA